MRHMVNVTKKRPQVRRMHIDEVVQHALLAITFIALVISGFALRYDQGFVARFFFGWEGGFEVRGVLHRAAAVGFMGTIIWHVLFLFSSRGRRFAKDMMPKPRDFQFFLRRMIYNLGLRPRMGVHPAFQLRRKGRILGAGVGHRGHGHHRAHALVRQLVHSVPSQGRSRRRAGDPFLGGMARFTLAIFVWHFYSVIFHPHVYPMNPSWITGQMPEDMYEHEHPGHLEEARRETERVIEKRIERMRRRNGEATAGTTALDAKVDSASKPPETDGADKTDKNWN